MSDANWFFSACAQTSGAIVAIVGGFLVSRLVTLDSERRGASEALKLAKKYSEDAQRRQREAEQELHDLEFEHFHSTVVWEVVGSSKEWTDEALIRSYEGSSLSEDELLEIITEIRRTAREAAQFYKSRGIDASIMANLRFEEAADGLPELPALTRSVYRAVFRKVRQLARNQVRAHERIPQLHPEWMDVPTVNIGEQVAEQSLRDAAHRRVIEAKYDVDRAASAVDVHSMQLASRHRPRGLLAAWGVLAYLCVFGVAVPLALLPTGETASCWKNPVLALVLLGLLLLLGYFWFLVSGATSKED